MATVTAAHLSAEPKPEPAPRPKPRRQQNRRHVEDTMLRAHGHRALWPEVDAERSGRCPLCATFLAKSQTGENGSWVVESPVRLEMRPSDRDDPAVLGEKRDRCHARCYLKRLREIDAALPEWAGHGTDW